MTHQRATSQQRLNQMVLNVIARPSYCTIVLLSKRVVLKPYFFRTLRFNAGIATREAHGQYKCEPIRGQYCYLNILFRIHEHGWLLKDYLIILNTSNRSKALLYSEDGDRYHSTFRMPKGSANPSQKLKKLMLLHSMSSWLSSKSKTKYSNRKRRTWSTMAYDEADYDRARSESLKAVVLFTIKVMLDQCRPFQLQLMQIKCNTNAWGIEQPQESNGHRKKRHTAMSL